ncbi:hypothetical protein ACFYPK_33125 [Streptomyces halstedii]|uniref:hypothetical protein n=2 Tax=Streptomyces halstedii TaxID=1944 RepID=UPI00346092B2|nr:hypothetical protein OG291_00025 [Streptomyces halstedii]WSX39859.1 hypothetical protein OG291_31540 [Streptomyces halstedii]
MNLNDLMPLMKRRQDGGLGFERFRTDPALTGLSWPDDVLRDFLYEHGDHGPFVDDYGHLDLSTITWTLESIPTVDFHTMPTGESEAGLIEHFAQHPVHWVTVRPPQVGQHWNDHGTWLRPPLLIDRRTLNPGGIGLQVLEGRTRVGVLRGRLREQLYVASEHAAWVGRS